MIKADGMKSRASSPGRVYLIGAGPGDEGLITVKGLEALKKAEVIVYDYHANRDLLKNCSEGSEEIYVGKTAGKHAFSQKEINRLLVSKAKEGKNVARLKGGDPFIFGRGGEEALELAENSIPFEIIPGITAAVAAAAYAGIPITQRGLTSSVALITGHEDPSKQESDLDWEKISTGVGTLVFYMGVKNLSYIVSRLIACGRPENTPAALIRWATLSCQETLTGRLNDIVSRAKEKDFRPPAIFVVGEVVGLRDKLSWFEKKPLYGRRIVVTRSRDRISDLSTRLRELGAQVIEFPTIEIKPVSDFRLLDQAIGEIESYSWLVFTSANGVEIFFARLLAAGHDSRILKGVRIAVIGRETGHCLGRFGIKPDLLPERFTSEGALEAFRSIKSNYREEKILFPGSEIAGDVLPVGLEEMGARVERIPVYRNLVPEYSGIFIDSIFSGSPDLVTFTSSSTAANLAEILKKYRKEQYLEKIRGASIGPVTSRTAKKLGITVSVEADPHTISDLAAAISAYFRH